MAEITFEQKEPLQSVSEKICRRLTGKNFKKILRIYKIKSQ